MNKNKTSFMKKIKAKKNTLLTASMLLFALAYPLTYLSAESGAAPFMAAAVFVTALGSLLAAVL
jgi:hypothetical protein